MSATDYPANFYESIREGCKSSAAVIVPILLEELAPIRSVVDVGCGEGWFTLEFQNRGCKVLGIEGAHVDPVVPYHHHADLEREIPDIGLFDLAVCLEVAEHLSPERADSFVEDLCRLAPVIAFSAAISGQGGAGHLNEQWSQYWVQQFYVNNFTCSAAIRWMIWDDDRVENWYRQNILIAARYPDDYPRIFDTPLAKVHDVVHPVLFDARRR